MWSANSVDATWSLNTDHMADPPLSPPGILENHNKKQNFEKRGKAGKKRKL